MVFGEKWNKIENDGCRNMNTKGTYRYLVRSVLTALMPLFLLSCEKIKDNMDDCGIYLEFIYEYNMEYADSFEPQVGSVDIFVFDAEGRYLFMRQSSREELIGRKRMFLGDDLAFGNYKILTVGGLSDSFRLSDGSGNTLIPGQTQLEDIRLSLVRGSEIVSHEFPPVWIGVTQDIRYQADLSVYQIPLVKETNHFDLVLARAEESPKVAADTENVPYTFEIVTPEGAVYGHDNRPKRKETVTFRPYLLTAGGGVDELSEAHINSNRLLYMKDYDYRLIVRSTSTGKVLWDYDLMYLLEHTKPASRPDGSLLPMQEYLDRQSEWHIVVLYKEEPGGDPGGFIAVKVIVNDWIIWINDIGV